MLTAISKSEKNKAAFQIVYPPKKHSLLSPQAGIPQQVAAPLKILREKRRISQKALAKKIGIERTRLIRLERKHWKELSVGDVELLSRGMEMNLNDLIRYLKGFDGTGGRTLERTHLKTPYFVIDSKQGYKLNSLLKQPGHFFAGVLNLDPHKTWPCEACLQGRFLFYQVLEGEVLVTLSSKEYLIREKECFSLQGETFYEFYNPHQFKEAAVLLFAGDVLSGGISKAEGLAPSSSFAHL